MDKLLEINFLQFPLSIWLLGAAISAGGVVTALFVRWISTAIVRRNESRNREANADSDEPAENNPPRFSVTLRLVQRFIFQAIILAGFYAGSTVFNLQGNTAKILSGIFITLFSLVLIRFFLAVVNEAFNRAAESDSSPILSRYRPLRSILVVVIWIAGALFLLANLGFDIRTIVAGIGIGGIAVALAGQAVLGDLFGYFVILFDKPFELGDFLILGDVLGSVEKIGIKTTRIRSLSGEQIIMSNSDLTNSRVRNYKRMQKRRVVFKIGVVYGTPAEAVREIPDIIRNIIENEELVIFDRAHFATYGDWSLIYEVVYNIASADYNTYMDIQQRINLGIYDAFSQRNIQFAFPTQTVMLPDAGEKP